LDKTPDDEPAGAAGAERRFSAPRESVARELNVTAARLPLQPRLRPAAT
jgi:hypothetical protein